MEEVAMTTSGNVVTRRSFDNRLARSEKMIVND